MFLAFVSTTMVAQSNTDAPYIKSDNQGFLPIAKKGFHPQISVAPQVGYISFGDLDADGILYGLEIALQCPMLCTKKNYIRQQLSFVYHSKDNFTYWAATLNPEYRFFVRPSFELAAGPSLGVSNGKAKFLDVVTFDDTKFTYGVSTSATLHFNVIFVALSGRYLLTGENDLNANYNNFQALLKLGFNF